MTLPFHSEDIEAQDGLSTPLGRGGGASSLSLWPPPEGGQVEECLGLDNLCSPPGRCSEPP